MYLFQYDAKARPLFPEIVSKLAEIKEGLDDSTWAGGAANNTFDRSPLIPLLAPSASCCRFIYCNDKVSTLQQLCVLCAARRRSRRGRARVPACGRGAAPQDTAPRAARTTETVSIIHLFNTFSQILQ